LRLGQEKGEARSGTTGKPFDEPKTEKTVTLRVARGWAPGALRRSDDVPHRPSRRACRIASPARNADASTPEKSG